MELIAEKPIYFGQGRMVQVGQPFEVPELAIANQFVETGRARFGQYERKPITPVDSVGLISCIMPTKNRRLFLPRAIRCYLDQTYQRTELVVLDNGESVADLMPKDSRIRYMRLASNQTTGQLRNFCCQMARGEFIAHWDDDDWSHPRRLEDQLSAIGDKQVTGYHSILFHGPGVYRYEGKADYAVGTSLFYRRSHWERHRFKSVNIGEDTDFVSRAGGSLVAVDGTGRVVASVHPGNTSPRDLRAAEREKKTPWKRVDECVLPEGYYQV